MFIGPSFSVERIIAFLTTMESCPQETWQSDNKKVQWSEKFTIISMTISLMSDMFF